MASNMLEDSPSLPNHRFDLFQSAQLAIFSPSANAFTLGLFRANKMRV
jgi:hypothetical protein